MSTSSPGEDGLQPGINPAAVQEFGDDSVVPELREDLQLLQGAPQHSGEASWLIYDPPRHRYFQVGRKTIALLKNWQAGTVADICDAALSEAEADAHDIEELVRFLYLNSLTLTPPENDARNYAAQANAGTQSRAGWLVHNYLFFRIPLVRPGKFLRRTLPATRILFTRGWWLFMAGLLLLSGYLVMRQWDEFVNTFWHLFSFQGALVYLLSLVIVKSLHELGHAYALTRYGGRVATMGIAFLVMFPVLYTDTTDTWKLRSRRQRLVVSGAGVGVELTIAVLATFAWAFLPDGPARSIAFFAATTSWVLSLAVNLNPLIRFDGYHFLADAMGVENLQARSFAFGRWSLRELLFDLGEPPPEVTSRVRRRWLTVFAWSCWVYRFFLFLAIALLVYAFFFKALGIVLFIIEIVWFIVNPIVSELKAWWQRRQVITSRRRSLWLPVSALSACVVLLIPWRWDIEIPAVLEVEDQLAIHAHSAGVIRSVFVTEGQYVTEGELLIAIESPELDNRWQQSRSRLALLEARLGRTAVDEEDLDQIVVLKRERLREQARLSALESEREFLQIVAPRGGVVVDLAQALHPGRWINDQLQLANLVSKQGVRVRGYVSATEVKRLRQGSESRFVPDVLELHCVDGHIESIADTYAEQISIAALTSRFDGAIAVSETSTELEPLGAWYNVVVQLDDKAYMPDRVTRGVLHAQGEPESLAAVAWRQVMRVLVRESSV